MSSGERMPRHGTPGEYVNHKCRCRPCTDANNAYMRDYRDRKRGQAVPDHVHGTENGYCNYMCRCDDCRWAHAATARRSTSEATP